MDENEKKEPETAQEPPKPEDYSRYMGTLNRIYRRNNNPQRKKLGDGITSLKKGQQPAAPAPEPGKKDRSFLVVAGGAIVLMAILSFSNAKGPPCSCTAVLLHCYKTQTFSVRNFSTASMAAASSSPSAVTVMVSP